MGRPKWVPYLLWCWWRETTVCRKHGHRWHIDEELGTFCPVCARSWDAYMGFKEVEK